MLFVFFAFGALDLRLHVHVFCVSLLFGLQVRLFFVWIWCPARSFNFSRGVSEQYVFDQAAVSISFLFLFFLGSKSQVACSFSFLCLLVSRSQIAFLISFICFSLIFGLQASGCILNLFYVSCFCLLGARSGQVLTLYSVSLGVRRGNMLSIRLHFPFLFLFLFFLFSRLQVSGCIFLFFSFFDFWAPGLRLHVQRLFHVFSCSLLLGRQVSGCMFSFFYVFFVCLVSSLMLHFQIRVFSSCFESFSFGGLQVAGCIFFFLSLLVGLQVAGCIFFFFLFLCFLGLQASDCIFKFVYLSCYVSWRFGLYSGRERVYSGRVGVRPGRVEVRPGRVRSLTWEGRGPCPGRVGVYPGRR